MRPIDADAAIAVVRKWLEDVFCVPGKDDDFTVFKRLQRLPTVDAEPVRHGRWMPHKTKTGKNWWECNLCGTVSEHKTQHYFCHFCGAKMDLEEENAEVH